MEKEKNIFGFDNYKEYLNDYIGSLPKAGRGFKRELAEHIKCQSTYVSQVLGGDKNFSMEQSARLKTLLALNKEEGRYLMFLIELEKAGTVELKNHYKDLINDLKIEWKGQQEKLKLQEIATDKQREIYYSAWYYSAVHALLSIPKYQTVKNLGNLLNLSPEKIMEILSFLLSAGLAAHKGHRFITGETRVGATPGSKEYKKGLKNWREQGIRSIERGSSKNVHQTLVFTIDQENRKKLLEKIKKFHDDVRDLANASPNAEFLEIINIDYFGY